MTEFVLTSTGVEEIPEIEDLIPYYPQCYLYQSDEVELERKLNSLQMALFIAGVDLGTAQQAAKVITSIKPGFIISRAEYQVIHQALGEIK